VDDVLPEHRRQHLTAELGRGSLCLWSHNVPDDPSADVWIEASDRIIGGQGMRTAFVRQR
jgi:hypothetical protein